MVKCDPKEAPVSEWFGKLMLFTKQWLFCFVLFCFVLFLKSIFFLNKADDYFVLGTCHTSSLLEIWWQEFLNVRLVSAIIAFSDPLIADNIPGTHTVTKNVSYLTLISDNYCPIWLVCYEIITFFLGLSSVAHQVQII